jgi:hypothetical protein
VKFDDGDVLNNASRRSVCARGDKGYECIARMDEAKWDAKALSKTTKQPQAETAVGFNGWTLLELLHKACGRCDKCKKKDCGDCGSCKVNRFGNERVCCFHRVRCCSYATLPESRILMLFFGLYRCAPRSRNARSFKLQSTCPMLLFASWSPKPILIMRGFSW